MSRPILFMEDAVCRPISIFTFHATTEPKNIHKGDLLWLEEELHSCTWMSWKSLQYLCHCHFVTSVKFDRHCMATEWVECSASQIKTVNFGLSSSLDRKETQSIRNFGGGTMGLVTNYSIYKDLNRSRERKIHQHKQTFKKTLQLHSTIECLCE